MPTGTDAGSAYAFTRSGTAWSPLQKITPGTPQPGALFGASVVTQTAIDQLFVGAPGWNAEGSVYVYNIFGGSIVPLQILSAGLTADGPGFGSSISCDDHLAVGAPQRDDAAGIEQGSVFVYGRTDTDAWEFPAELQASDAQAGDHFGSSLAIDGGTLVVGAPHNDDQGANSGAIYLAEVLANIGWEFCASLPQLDRLGGQHRGHWHDLISGQRPHSARRSGSVPTGDLLLRTHDGLGPVRERDPLRGRSGRALPAHSPHGRYLRAASGHELGAHRRGRATGTVAFPGLVPRPRSWGRFVQPLRGDDVVLHPLIWVDTSTAPAQVLAVTRFL